MALSESLQTRKWTERLRQADWRACVALAWAIWFGVLYGKMVVQERGEKIRAVFSTLNR